MKNAKQHPVEISQTDGEVTIRITGAAYRNLARIARTVNALPGVGLDEEERVTPVTLAMKLGGAGHLTTIDDPEQAAGALEYAVKELGVSIAYALPYAAFGE